MRWTSPLAGLAAAGAFALAGPAGAAVTTYTYTGAVRGGYDQTGVFGAPGRDLGGLSFAAVFRRDDAVSGATEIAAGPKTAVYGSGPSTPVTGFLTIDGVTWAFLPTTGEQLQYDDRGACGPNCDVEVFSHSATTGYQAFDPGEVVLRRDVSYLKIRGFSASDNRLPGPDYRSLPGFTSPGPFEISAAFDIAAFLFDTSIPAYTYRATANGSLQVNALTVTTDAAGAIPEPGAWALMILGFAGAGAALRRGRRAAFA